MYHQKTFKKKSTVVICLSIKLLNTGIRLKIFFSPIKTKKVEIDFGKNGWIVKKNYLWSLWLEFLGYSFFFNDGYYKIILRGS